MKEATFLPRPKILLAFLIGILSISFLYAQDTLQIKYGDNVTGNISVKGEKDAYSFTGETRDIIIIRMRFSSSTGGPRIELYNPSGVLVTSKSGSNGIIWLETVTLAETGMYTILVMESGGDDTGSYSLSLQSLKFLEFEAILPNQYFSRNLNDNWYRVIAEKQGVLTSSVDKETSWGGTIRIKKNTLQFR